MSVRLAMQELTRPPSGWSRNFQERHGLSRRDGLTSKSFYRDLRSIWSESLAASTHSGVLRGSSHRMPPPRAPRHPQPRRDVRSFNLEITLFHSGHFCSSDQESPAAYVDRI